MSRKIDLTGRRFERLVVTKKSEDKNKYGAILWDCVCDCGNNTTATTSHLNSNHKKSCGCLIKENGGVEQDLTGKRYGRLEVISKAEKYIYGGRYWTCKCDCGVTKDILGTSLRRGLTVSCGCYISEISKESINKAHEWSKENDLKEGTKLSALNAPLFSTNTSGYKGVCWSKKRSCWEANIGFKGKRIYLGGFKNKQDAINARLEAEEKYFKPILEKYEKKTDRLQAKSV